MPSSPACRLALLALVGLAPPLAAQEPPPSPVRVAPVERRVTTERRQVTGNLRAASRAQIAAVESGQIVAVEVVEADHVEVGQVLARLDDRRLRRDLEQARAELDTAAAELEIRRTEARAARDDLTAYEQSASEVAGSISVINLRAARRDAAVAEARVVVAERGLTRLDAGIARLEIQLADTVIRAPFAGHVVAISTQPGEWASPGSPICTLISSERIEAWLDVPEQFSLEALAETTDVTVEIATLGARLPATRVRVIPDVDPRSRRYVLIADLSFGERRLAPGMSVTAALPTGGEAELARVPSDAILSDGGGYFVYRILEHPQRGSIAAPVSVVPRFTEGSFRWVASDDLAHGDPVVVEGNERLRPMSPVQVIEAGAPLGGSK